MSRSSAAIALTILLVSACLETVDAQVTPDILRQGREIAGQYLAETGTPGLSIAIGVGGRLVWAEGFGLADVEHNVPVQNFTRFRIASVSKSLTSAAVGLLHEQELLDLDRPVQAYVPSFPEKEYPITTWHLGTHLSGLPHYEAGDFVNLIPYESVVDALDKRRTGLVRSSRIVPATTKSPRMAHCGMRRLPTTATCGRLAASFRHQETLLSLAMRC